MLLAVVLTLLLAVYNNVFNLFRPGRYSYVAVNLTTSVVLVGAGVLGGLSWAAMGLAPSTLGRGFAWGASIAGLAGAGLMLATNVRGLRRLMADRRVAGLTTAGLAYMALVKIPFGTVVLEEIAFRGVLFGAWLRLASPVGALVATSVVFGLWHVVPAMEMLRVNGVALSGRRRWALVAGACAATAVAGVFFGWLRLSTGSILAPVLVHAAVNSFAAVGAFSVHLGRTAPAAA